MSNDIHIYQFQNYISMQQFQERYFICKTCQSALIIYHTFSHDVALKRYTNNVDVFFHLSCMSLVANYCIVSKRFMDFVVVL